jgi:hypothetical protein
MSNSVAKSSICKDSVVLSKNVRIYLLPEKNMNTLLPIDR